MGKTKRAQILVTPEEYEALEDVARAERTSVAELFRRAVRDRYLRQPVDRARLVEELCALELAFDGDWGDAEVAILDAHEGLDDDA